MKHNNCATFIIWRKELSFYHKPRFSNLCKELCSFVQKYNFLNPGNIAQSDQPVQLIKDFKPVRTGL